MSNLLNIRIIRFMPAVALVILGTLGFFNVDLIRPNQYLFGIFATAPLVNLAVLGAGIALAAKQKGRAILPSDRWFNYATQALAVIFAILAIGGFISLALQMDTWLTILPNTMYSDILWAILAMFGLYQAWWKNV